MRFAMIILCGAAICLMDISPASVAQSNGPATDKVDATPPDAATQPSPTAAPDTAPPVPPDTATPAPAAPEQTPPELPPQAQQQKPAAGSGGTVELVEPGQAVSILGKKVVGQDGKAILGPVIDILVDRDGKPRAAVIDFGGFLGVGSRHVAIDWNSLKFRLDDRDAPVQLDLDPAAIKAAPEYKEVDATAEVVEPALASPTPLPPIAPLSELPIAPIEPQALPTDTRATKNAGQ